ncbi:GNAT family N-acetyltransferase [Actinoplanes sp. NPDC051513]|uniref:GNAT family N-acetyltransferase n=1 Tax=Actinoplanes sp. NPDC051513 TaxID=3363908 RepID=UPI0037872C94
MDARIQQSVVSNLSGRPAPIRSGPFILGIDPATESPGINYATPIPGAPISAADVSAMVTAFCDAQRKPRLEYVVSTAPDLERLLLEAGFTIEERHEYLICLPETLSVPPTPDGFVLREPSTDDDRAAMSAAQHEAFGGTPEASAADVARMSRLQSRGGVAVMAVTPDGACAGGGQAVPPSDGVSEVAGIAVPPAYRRRGVAAAFTADITSRLFNRGAEIAWLEASGPDSWRIYERIGYQPTGMRLYISMP